MGTTSFKPVPTERTCFVVATKKGKWCIVFRTLYWCETADHDWVNQTARTLSESLDCEAIASCGGGHGLSTCIYDVGTLEAELPAYDRGCRQGVYFSKDPASHVLYRRSSCITVVDRVSVDEIDGLKFMSHNQAVNRSGRRV